MGNPNAIVAHDVYGLSLTYYAGDYKPIDNSRWSTVADRFEAETGNSDLLASRHNLYNGNIGIMVNAIMDSLHNPQPLGNAYRYDQLNRIVESKSFTNVNTGTNSWNQDQSYSGEYQNTFAYDANGNITKQLRKNAAGADIDSLTYRYETNTNGEPIRNRLYHVQDNVGDGQYDDDIDDMGAFTDGTSVNTQNNYRYNEIGQLAKDVQEEIDTIIWRITNFQHKLSPKCIAKKNLICIHRIPHHIIMIHKAITSGVIHRFFNGKPVALVLHNVVRIGNHRANSPIALYPGGTKNISIFYYIYHKTEMNVPGISSVLQ